MSSVPVQLIVAAFQDERGADRALKQLKGAKKEHLISIENAAVIRKDAQGKLHISETGDMRGGKGAAFGGVTGAALGILTGGTTLAIAGVSALIGGLAAKLRDSGFKDERLRKLGASLRPGSSAIVAVIDHIWVADLERELRNAGADVLTEAIAADVAAQLEAGEEVLYTAVATDEAIVAARIATGQPAATQDAAAGKADGGEDAAKAADKADGGEDATKTVEA
jgi:uncharacterized membrane protein